MQRKFYIISFFLIISRLADGITTYMVTPDLSLEKNPLVIYLNFGWFAMITLGVLLVLILIFLTYIGQKYQNLFYIRSTTFSNYVADYFYEKRINSFSFMLKLPKFKKSIVFLGNTLPLTLIIYSLILTVSNILMYQYDWYPILTHKFFVAKWIFFLPLIIFLLLSINLLYRHYKRFNILDSSKNN